MAYGAWRVSPVIKCCNTYTSTHVHKFRFKYVFQRAKKVVSDLSLKRVDYAIGQVSFVHNLPDGQFKYLEGRNYNTEEQ